VLEAAPELEVAVEVLEALELEAAVEVGVAEAGRLERTGSLV